MDELTELEIALRSDRHAALLCDDTPTPVRTVIDNATGRLVFPAGSFAFEAEQTVLWVPEERSDAMQVLVMLEEIDGSICEAADRWRIYHGGVTEPCWAQAEIVAVRFGPIVADGDEVDLRNPVAADEPGLCKRYNADHESLGRLAHAFDPRSTGPGTLVGVDGLGIDIRTAFDIIRVPFGQRQSTGEGAGEGIDRLIEALTSGA